MKTGKFFSIVGVMTVLVLGIGGSVWAQNRELLTVMREMGQAFSALSRPLNQGQLTGREAEVAARFVGLVQEARGVPPKGLPQESVERFLALMGELEAEALALEESLLRQDLDAARLHLRRLGQLRSEGHGEFKN